MKQIPDFPIYFIFQNCIAAEKIDLSKFYLQVKVSFVLKLVFLFQFKMFNCHITAATRTIKTEFHLIICILLRPWSCTAVSIFERGKHNSIKHSLRKCFTWNVPAHWILKYLSNSESTMINVFECEQITVTILKVWQVEHILSQFLCLTKGGNNDGGACCAHWAAAIERSLAPSYLRACIF